MLEGLPTVAAGTDAARSILIRAAWVRMSLGASGLVAGVFYLVEAPPGATVSAHAPNALLYLIAPPFLILLAALRALVSLRGLDRPLDPEGAFGRWGTASIVDAIALVPWLLAISPILAWLHFPSAPILGPSLWISLVVPTVCGIFHVVVLPAWLLGADPPDPSARDLEPPPGPADLIWDTFARMARRKVILLVIALATLLLPWMSASSAKGLFAGWPGGGGPGEPAQGELLLGVELVAGVGGVMAAWFSDMIVVALLILLGAAIWESRRARWRRAPRWSQTRVFVSWMLLLALAAWPTYQCGVAGYLLLGRDSPHVGLWLFAVAVGVYVLHLIALTPLAAWGALQRRSEAEREEELRDRGTESR